MRFRSLFVALLAFLSAAEVVLAEALPPDMTDSSGLEEMRDFYGDEAFITIATGSSKPIYKAPSVATVITSDEIKAMGARNLNEVLESVPGLHVSPSALNRLDSIYSIRGIHTGFNPQVLLLMNGIPFPNIYSGSRPNLFRLPVSSISRIEVIRGPGSAVLGADAFAGVINVITKNSGNFDVGEIGGRVGSFDSHDVWLVQKGKFGPLEANFSLEWQESDGDNDRTIDHDLQTSLDQKYATNASLAPSPLSTRYEVLDAHLEMSYRDILLRNWYWHLSDAGIGAGGAQALDPKGRQDVDQYLADLTFSKSISSDLNMTSTASFLFRESDSYFVLLPPGTVVPIDPDDGNLNFSDKARLVSFPEGMIGSPGGVETQFGIDAYTIYDGFENNRLRLGLGTRYFDYEPSEQKNFGPGVIDGTVSSASGNLLDVSDTPYSFIPERSRTIWYLSLQDEVLLARDWELTAGLRYDYYSDFGDTLNPRVALVWATRYNLTSKLLYGSAFRAPSFSELYAVNNPSVLGNRDLKPESIDTFELSFDYKPIFNFQSILSFFFYRAENMIQFVQNPGTTTKTAQNFGTQEGYGLELEIDWRPSEKVRLQGHYGYQYSEDVRTERRVADAPEHKAYLLADWQFFPKWHIAPQVSWVGDRARALGDTRAQIDDYTLCNLTLRARDIFEGYEFSLAGRNIFNQNAREPSNGTIPGDYPLEGRSLWFEARYRFAL